MQIFSGMDIVTRGFIKWFNAFYYVRVHCPLCKEKILAKASKCPYCKTNFRLGSYRKRLEWQYKAKIALFTLSLCVGFVIGLTGAGFLSTPFIIIGLYSIGFVVIQKIQSFKNFHYKP